MCCYSLVCYYTLAPCASIDARASWYLQNTDALRRRCVAITRYIQLYTILVQRCACATAAADEAMLPPAQVLAHPSVYLCGGGWLFFVAENAVLSENRQVFIDRLGDRGYKSCYGLLSTCSLASVAYGLWRHGPGPRLRIVGTPSLALGSALTCVGLVGAFNLAPALANPLGDDFTGCPLDLKAVRAEKASDVVGLERVTRHPQFWSLGFLALAVASSPSRPRPRILGSRGPRIPGPRVPGHYHALICVALRCIALHCFALRCIALHCFALI